MLSKINDATATVAELTALEGAPRPVPDADADAAAVEGADVAPDAEPAADAAAADPAARRIQDVAAEEAVEGDAAAADEATEGDAAAADGDAATLLPDYELLKCFTKLSKSFVAKL